MINLFKRVTMHILLHTLKYTPVVGRVVQEACNRELVRKPRSLEFIPDIFKTQEMCNKAVKTHSCILRFVPFHFWTNRMINRAIEKYMCPMIMSDYLNTQEKCERVVENSPCTLRFVPGHFNTQEMCDRAVRDEPSSLQYVPDCFVTREQIQMWYDKSEYCDDLFKEYNGYKKRKTQKAKIKEEFLLNTWYPNGVMDWCMPEEEKTGTEKLWDKYRPFCIL